MFGSNRRMIVGGLAAAVMGAAMNMNAHAALVRETFDTPAVGEAAVEATYPNFNFTTTAAGGDVSVGGGVLTLDNSTGTNSNQEMVLLPSGVHDLHRVSALVSAGNSNGSYNVGIRIGGNNIVFHPNFGGAALRVEGAGGFGNTNVGFTPPNNTLHLLQIDQTAADTFNVRLVNGADPSQVFTTSFTNTASLDGEIALRRSGPGGAGGTQTGLYDALTVVSGTTLYFNGFDFPVANAAQFTNANPDFTLNVGGGKTLDVTGGVARLGGDASNATFVVNGLGSGENDLLISADVGSTFSNGGHNVGLRIGENNIVFHPGFGGGAFRVEGPGGFGNTNMGFTPANNVMHHLEVLAGIDGLFEITFTDGLNPDNVFKTSFSNLNSVGGGIGFRQEGPLNGNFGMFDNLRVDAIIPEPGTLGLLSLAGLALLRRRRHA